MVNLREIAKQWSACNACDLSGNRHRVVVVTPWRHEPTDTDPLILIVGEAPGRQEDRTGQAFIGESGQILRTDILIPAGVRLGAITNVAGCWPGKNNPDPTPGQIEACAPRLDALVEYLQPDGLLTVGRISTRVRAHPWRRHFDGRPTASIVHPASLLRKGHPNAETAKTIRAQVAKVRNLLKKLGVRPTDDTATDTCDHDLVQAGNWIHKDGVRTPFTACTKCGLLGV